LPETRAEPPGALYRVQVGAFAERSNASEMVARLLADGFTAYIVRDGGLLKVRVGAFRDRAAADELAARLRAKGYSVAIIH
jgi:N-acetylmuramoyl-L-alanine amidase